MRGFLIFIETDYSLKYVTKFSSYDPHILNPGIQHMRLCWVIVRGIDKQEYSFKMSDCEWHLV